MTDRRRFIDWDRGRETHATLITLSRHNISAVSQFLIIYFIFVCVVVVFIFVILFLFLFFFLFFVFMTFTMSFFILRIFFIIYFCSSFDFRSHPFALISVPFAKEKKDIFALKISFTMTKTIANDKQQTIQSVQFMKATKKKKNNMVSSQARSARILWQSFSHHNIIYNNVRMAKFLGVMLRTKLLTQIFLPKERFFFQIFLARTKFFKNQQICWRKFSRFEIQGIILMSSSNTKQKVCFVISLTYSNVNYILIHNECM